MVLAVARLIIRVVVAVAVAASKSAAVYTALVSVTRAREAYKALLRYSVNADEVGTPVIRGGCLCLPACSDAMAFMHAARG